MSQIRDKKMLQAFQAFEILRSYFKLKNIVEYPLLQWTYILSNGMFSQITSNSRNSTWNFFYI